LQKTTRLLNRELLLFINNGRAHAAYALQETVWELKWELPDHLSYSPDLALSNFHLFGPLIEHLGGKHLSWQCRGST